MLSACRCPQAAILASRWVCCRSLFPEVLISENSKEVMAHTPSGSAQRGCIRMPYTAPELSAGLSLSRYIDFADELPGQGKGENLAPFT